MRTLGRKRAVKRKSFLMFRRNDRSLSRPRLRSATLPEGEGIGRHAAKFQLIRLLTHYAASPAMTQKASKDSTVVMELTPEAMAPSREFFPSPAAR